MWNRYFCYSLVIVVVVVVVLGFFIKGHNNITVLSFHSLQLSGTSQEISKSGAALSCTRKFLHFLFSEVAFSAFSGKNSAQI